MKKRLTAALLLAAMLTSLAACADDSDKGGDDTTSDTATETAEMLPGGIEKCDYGNANFNILAPNWGLYKTYFFSDENDGDAMSKAIYDRELGVEEYLGVNITHEMAPGNYEIFTTIQSNVMAEDDTYQMALTHCQSGIAALITGEYLLDMNDLGIDFSAEWWNHSANESLAIRDTQPFAVGDYMIPDPNVILVNLDMVELMELEDPYQLVRDGKWTIDKMLEMMGKVTTDNGDTVWDVNDTYGFGSPGGWYLNSFLYSSDITLVEKNSDGEYYLTFDQERTNTLFEKLQLLLNGPDTYIYNYKADNDPTLAAESLNISKGRSLFGITTLNNASALRDIELNYGILPYPKLDEAQDGYYNNDWSGMMCVPKTVKNTEMIGKVIELLNYHSTDLTIPAYYDVVLGSKLARDDGSAEMLDIIFDGIIFDAGMCYMYNDSSSNMSQLMYMADKYLVKEGQNNLASWIAKYKPGAEKEIEAFNEIIAEME